MSEIRNFFFLKTAMKYFLSLNYNRSKNDCEGLSYWKFVYSYGKELSDIAESKYIWLLGTLKKNNTVARENVKNVTIATTYIYHFVPHIMNYYCAKSQTNRLKFRFYMIFFLYFFHIQNGRHFVTKNRNFLQA